MARYRLSPQEVVHLRGQRQADGLRQADQSGTCSQDIGAEYSYLLFRYFVISLSLLSYQ